MQDEYIPLEHLNSYIKKEQIKNKINKVKNKFQTIAIKVKEKAKLLKQRKSKKPFMEDIREVVLGINKGMENMAEGMGMGTLSYEPEIETYGGYKNGKRINRRKKQKSVSFWED